MKGLGLRSLIRNFSVTLGRQLLAGLLMLAATAIIARTYGPEGNGIYAVALLLPSFLATFLSLGIASANVYYLGAKKVSVREVFWGNSRVYILLVIIGLILGGGAITWNSEYWFSGVPEGLLWLALFIFPILLMQSYLLSIFQGLQDFRNYNLILLAQPVFFLLVVGIVSLLNASSIALILLMYIVAMVISVTLGFWQVKKHITHDATNNKGSYVKQSINYGWKAHLSNILAFINYKVDIFLVSLFLGAASVGIYIIAVLITERLWLISQAVSTVLLPRLSQLSSDEVTRKQLTPLVSRYTFMATLFVGCLLGLTAYWLIIFIFGSEYMGAVLPLLILLPGIILLAPSRVLANDIAARGFPEKNMYVDAITVFCNFIGNIVLIPLYGLAGAALATTIAYSLNLLLRLILYGRFTGNKWYLSVIPSAQDVRLVSQLLSKV